VAFF